MRLPQRPGLFVRFGVLPGYGQAEYAEGTGYQSYGGIAAAAVFQRTDQGLSDAAGRFVDADTFLRAGADEGVEPEAAGRGALDQVRCRQGGGMLLGSGARFVEARRPWRCRSSAMDGGPAGAAAVGRSSAKGHEAVARQSDALAGHRSHRPPRAARPALPHRSDRAREAGLTVTDRTLRNWLERAVVLPRAPTRQH
jgi:hypothetical protein